MGAPLHLQVAVDRPGLRHAAQALREWLAAEGVAGEAAYGAELALEELGSNLLRHCSPAASATHLVITAVGQGNTLELALLDDGPAFDPTQASRPDLERPISERPIGGLGLLLVRRMAASLAYTRTPAGNRMVCTFLLGGAAQPSS